MSSRPGRHRAVVLGSAASLVVLWFGVAALYAAGTFWRNADGPFDPVAAERLEFWSGFRAGASALLDPGRLWRLSSAWFWLALVVVVAVTIVRWERTSGRSEGAGHWLINRGWLLWVPLLIGLAWSPLDAYSAMAALYSIHLLNTETIAGALGEALAAPWIGLATAASLGLASIFYRFVEPPRLKVWRRLTFAVIVGALSTVAVLRLQEVADARTRKVVLEELWERGVADGRIHWREDLLAAFRSGLLPERIYRVGGEISAPASLETPAPPYPAAFAETGGQAHLLLDLVIDAQGKVRQVWTYERLPLGFEESITSAVKTWRYAPAMRGDQPVAVYYSVAVRLGADSRRIGAGEPATPTVASVMASGLRGILVLDLADGDTSLGIHWTGGSSVCEITPAIADTWNHLVATVERGEPRTGESLGLEQPCSGDAVAVARARLDGKLDIWQIGAGAEPQTVDAAAAAVRVLLDQCGTGVSFEPSPRLVPSPSRGLRRSGSDRGR